MPRKLPRTYTVTLMTPGGRAVTVNTLMGREVVGRNADDIVRIIRKRFEVAGIIVTRIRNASGADPAPHVDYDAPAPLATDTTAWAAAALRRAPTHDPRAQAAIDALTALTRWAPA